MYSVKPLLIALIAASLVACGSSDSDDNSSQYDVPEQYQFNSFISDSSVGNDSSVGSDSSESSVSYGGQIARQIILADLKAFLEDTDANSNLAQAAIVDQALNRFVYMNADTGAPRSQEPVDSFGQGVFLYSIQGASFLDNPQSYNDISSGKNLVAKFVGQDKTTHLQNDQFIGWSGLTSANESDKPLELLLSLIEQYASLVASGGSPASAIPDENGATLAPALYVSDAGIDTLQLINKLSLMAVVFSQGTADYLQTDWSEVGINVDPDGIDKTYTTAEHKWDEAFGYFGAARDYKILSLTQRQTANDSNADQYIDLDSELNFAQSVNCAKRDAGSATNTQYGNDAINAFLLGRTIINQAQGDLNAQELIDLEQAAESASLAWEKCIAATVVHYINDVKSDMEKFSANGYIGGATSFNDLAKHWSEMKGFALGLQFNPSSPFVIDAAGQNAFEDLHDKLGQAPVLFDGTQAGVAYAGGVDAYLEDLDAAADIIQFRYGFAEADIQAW